MENQKVYAVYSIPTKEAKIFAGIKPEQVTELVENKKAHELCDSFNHSGYFDENISHYDVKRVIKDNEPANGLHLMTNGVIDFILAGKSFFTVKSLTTNKHFSYKVKASKDGGIHFVSVLVANERYEYIGFIRKGKSFVYGQKSTISFDSDSVKAFAYTFKVHSEGITKNKLQIFHAGRCGKCGRTLTHPESITNGIGPECQKMLDKNKKDLVV